MCALLLELQPGDEIIVPSFTFVSTANAFAMFGAVPVFADVDPVRFNLDPSDVERLLTPRTRAVVVVHYGGVPADLDSLLKICDAAGVPLIEDAAHGLFGSHAGKALGRFGALSTFSFHETKNISCGEGGALVINDERYLERAQIIREKGTDRSRFMQGLVDKYSWVDLGSSYLLADTLAAVLLAQLEDSASIQRRRRAAWRCYSEALAGWADANGVVLPQPLGPVDVDPAHLFAFLLPNPDSRQRFLAHSREHAVSSVFHYLPLNTAPFAQRFGAGVCPITEDISPRLARIPLFSDIEAGEVDRVIEAVVSFRA